MAAGGDAAQTSLLLDALKVFGGGVLGYGIKWLQARGASENKEIQACLDQLDGLTNDAVHSLFAILDGKVDNGLAYRVRVGRDDLGVKITRALGSTPKFQSVVVALGTYGKSLACADPFAGVASSTSQSDTIRGAQQELRSKIALAAKAKLWWRLSRHDVGK